MSVQHGHPTSVLIVDDAEDIRALLEFNLRDAGYLATGASDGASALAMAAEAPPDVVLLDLRLPDHDGLWVLDALKSDQRTESAPVLVVTADDSPDVLHDALARGAHDHITKPFRIDDLLARVGAAARVKREHDRVVEARLALRASRDFIGEVLDSLDAVVLVLDGDGRLVHVNRAAERLAGRSQAVLSGTEAWTVFMPDERPTAARHAFLPATEDRRWEAAFRAADGTVRTLSWSTRAVREEDGSTTMTVASGIDITDQRSADRRLRACLDVMVEGVAILDAVRDATGRIVDFTVADLNPAARALAPGLNIGQRRSQAPHPINDGFRTFVEVIEGNRAVQRRVDVDSAGPDGLGSVTFDVSATKLDDSVVVAFRDVTARRVAEERLAWAATHDPLTGLANRHLLVDHMTHALARRPANPTAELAVLFVDLDRFKQVNDELGHQAGDETLIAVARAIGRAVRPADTVARFGGDEFVVLAEELPDAAAAGILAARLEAAVAQVQAGPRRLHASVGVALAWDGATPEAILRRADQGMYHAKRRRTA